MRHLNKKLVVAAAFTAAVGAMGVSFAQSADPDPMATPQDVANPQQVQVNGNASGQQIYFLRDQGNSPETDPSAHLMLLKHPQMMPVAQTTTTTTTVAQSTTPDTSDTTTAMPSASDTSNTESADTAAAPADNTPALAPKADRN